MTTQTLEETIRGLAARGEITHISLVPSQDGKMWRSSFAMASKFGVSHAEDVDPVKAILLACTTAKMKPAPKVTKPTSIDLTAERIAETTPVDDLADIM